jgi:hypothetical protein
MADNGRVKPDELPFTPAKEELHRQLIEQFYESSVDRYGTDSEQARVFSRLLGAYASQSRSNVGRV